MSKSFFDNFWTALRFAKEIVANPLEATKENATFKQLVYFLFLISFIPAVLQCTLAYLGWTTIFDEFLYINLFFGTPILLIPLYVITIIGCNMALAALIQIVGRMFGFLEAGITETFAATAYATTPIAIFGWLFFVFTIEFLTLSTILLLVVRIVLIIWTAGLITIGLMNQHKTTLLKALLSFGIPSLVIVIITATMGGISYFYFLEALKIERKMGLIGIVCDTGSKHSIVVTNVGTMLITSDELKVYVDDSEVRCVWSGHIEPGGRATCEASSLTSEGVHKVRVIGPSNYVEGFSYCV